MKRFLIIAVLCLSALTAKAQTIEVVLGKQPRIFLEKTSVSKNATSFAYLEAGYKGGAMVKLFHEQKFWEAPSLQRQHCRGLWSPPLSVVFLLL